MAINKRKKTQVIDISNFFEIENTQEEYDLENEESLILYLKKCDSKYYSEGLNPLIPDSEYDRLRDLAENKWPDNEYFSQDNIGVKVSGEKVQHEFLLGSLSKYKEENINDWLRKLNPEGEIQILPKFDGLSVFVEIDNGKVIHAATRGDGKEGRDITEKIQIVLPELPCKEHLKLRGEIVLSGLETYKELGFMNRRNGASGIIGDKYVVPEKLKYLKVIFYEVISPELKLSEASKILGTSVCNPFFMIAHMKVSTIMLNPKQLDEILKEYRSDYEALCDLDGLVLIYNGLDDEYVRENTYKPSNKVAYKVASESTIAEVSHVEWQMSRTGKAVPVVNFIEPVLLSGTRVLRATGYNAAFILKNRITKGTKVKICKSGEIIPKILEVL